MTFSRLFCAVLVVAGSLGLFLGTPNPVFHVPGAVLVYPACLFLAAESGIPFRLGWCVGIPGAAAALYWIAVAAHMYGAFPWLLAAPCSLLLGTYVALWGGLSCLLAALVGEKLAASRPAGLLVRAARALDSTVTIRRGDRSVSAVELMNLMSMGVRQGEQITVTIEGGDEEASRKAMEHFFQENL